MNAQSTTMQHCSVFSLLLEQACLSEPEMTVMAGCVHEHLKWVAVCQWHAESLAKGETRCLECDGLGHYCEMSLLREVTS